MTQPLASHRPPAWAPGRTRPCFLPASRNRALCSSARRGSSRPLALHCDACLKGTRRACYPPLWSIQELTEVFSSIAHDCGDAVCNSATREWGTSGTAAASDADIEALASRTCASAARHSSATAAAAAAAALPFFKARAATSVATSNSASILRFASNCFALFATLSSADANLAPVAPNTPAASQRGAHGPPLSPHHRADGPLPPGNGRTFLEPPPVYCFLQQRAAIVDLWLCAK